MSQFHCVFSIHLLTLLQEERSELLIDIQTVTPAVTARHLSDSSHKTEWQNAGVFVFVTAKCTAE
jgi:hypothetical protein